MRTLGRSPMVVVLVVSAVALGVVALLAHVRFHASRSRLPEQGSWSVRVGGLEGRVEIQLDARGVPHIWASNEADAWFAQGYVHACDRFFEMDLMRRAANGTLAEVYGEAWLPFDRWMRTLRVAASAQRQAVHLDGAESETLRAYAAGVNAALKQHGRWVAPEIWLLGIDAAPWRVEDTLGLVVLLQLNLSGAAEAEARRSVVLARFGAERTAALWGWTPQQARRWIPPDLSSPLLEHLDEPLMPTACGGSSAWAVDGNRSVSSQPLLAAQLSLCSAFMGSWHVVHLEAPGMRLAGASLPGVPGVLLGHNEEVAWALAPSRLDDQDIFLVSLDETRSRERLDGAWKPLRTVTERIVIRWQNEPELLKVRISERGPLVRESNREALAVQATARYGPSPLRLFLQCARARSVNEIQEAAAEVLGPPLVIVGADRSGRVESLLVGQAPRRGAGAGRVVSPGAREEWAWRGFVVSNVRSYSKQGIAIAAEHDLFAEGDAPMDRAIAGDFAPPWRYRRIKSALAGTDRWDIGSTLDLMGDVVSGQAIAALRSLRPELEKSDGPVARSLMEWDGQMRADALDPHLFARLMNCLAREIGGDEAVREGLRQTPLSSEDVLRLFAGGIDEAWWDDLRTESLETRSSIIQRCLDRLDGERIVSTWGEVHRLRYAHRLIDFPLIGSLLRWRGCVGSIGLGGDEATVDSFGWDPRKPFAVTALPSLRMVIDLGAWDDMVLLLPKGESGRLWSAHRLDQLEAWRECRPQRVPFERPAVDAATRARLVLLPLPAGKD